MNEVAIIVPTCNRAIEVKRAIKSILAQTYNNYMVYVVGHGCTDNTQRVVKSFQDKRINWCNIARPFSDKGGAPPRNEGIRISRSEYVAYLDDDNYWYPNHLKNLIRLIKSNPVVSFVICAIENRDKMNPNIATGIRRSDEMKRAIIDTSCILHKRELINKYGIWKTVQQGGFANDWEIVHRWIRGNEKWLVHSEATLVYMNVSQKLRKEFFKSQQCENYIELIKMLDDEDRIYFSTQGNLLKVPIIT